MSDDFFDIFGDDLYGRHGIDILTGRRKGGFGRKPTDRNDDPQDFAHGCIGDDRTAKLPSCHYSDERFKNVQTIFGRRKKRTGYDYSDRFSMWDGQRGTNRWREGHELAEAESKKDDCNWAVGSVTYYEMVLSHFYQKPTAIDHVLTGFNVSDGYSYYVYGHYHPEAEKAAPKKAATKKAAPKKAAKKKIPAKKKML
jgi:hypothetical protein